MYVNFRLLIEFPFHLRRGVSPPLGFGIGTRCSPLKKVHLACWHGHPRPIITVSAVVLECGKPSGRKLIKEIQLPLFAGKYVDGSTTKTVVHGSGETPFPISKKEREKLETPLNELKNRQLRKQIEAQKESGGNAGTKTEGKTSQEYIKIGPSAFEHMFKHYLGEV